MNVNTIPDTLLQTAGRLAYHPSYKIDPEQVFHFEFDGKTYRGFAGDTIASALWAAGVKVLGRSFKYHRPRGAFALTSADSNTLVRVDDEPNARASDTLVKEGLTVKPQNVWPSLDSDLMSLTQMGSRFMPVGFYYKTFIRPKALWPKYEEFLRNAAGLGVVTQDVPTTYYDKKYEYADVLVIGGGPAGMSAALSAAKAGAKVLLLDENPFLGGHLAYERQTVPDGASGEYPAYELAKRLAQQIKENSNIRVELNTNAFGIYDHLWIGASQNDTRLLKIRTQSLVVANGAFEQPLLFENSDLPGVMLGSAVQRLMHLYGVKPGQRAVVLSANRDGLQTALDLHTAGVQVATVVELRSAPDSDLVEKLNAARIPLRTETIITKARGGSALSGVILEPAELSGGAGQVTLKSAGKELITCDLLAVSIGWTPATGLLYQAKAKLTYDEKRGPSFYQPNFRLRSTQRAASPERTASSRK